MIILARCIYLSIYISIYPWSIHPSLPSASIPFLHDHAIKPHVSFSSVGLAAMMIRSPSPGIPTPFIMYHQALELAPCWLQLATNSSAPVFNSYEQPLSHSIVIASFAPSVQVSHLVFLRSPCTELSISLDTVLLFSIFVQNRNSQRRCHIEMGTPHFRDPESP